MGHHTARKFTFVTTFAAAAMALMLAASDSIALEATEIGPGPAGQGVSPAVTGKGEGPWAKAGSTLRRVFTAHSAHQQAGGDAPFDPGNPSIQFAKGLILIDAVAASDGAALLEDLRGLGLTGGTQFGAVVSGRIPLGLLHEVVGLESLRGVSASLKPETNSAVDPTFGLVHDRRAAIAMSLIASQADPQTYTGDGIKVGVLSDTFDNNGFPDYDGDGWPDMPATFADDDYANGDLPGGGGYVALHVPGNENFNDASSYGAIATIGTNTTIDNTQFAHDRDLPDPDGSIRFDPASFNEDPITAFISYPDAPQYHIGSSAFTVEGWFKFAVIGDGNDGPMLASQFSTSVDQRAWYLAVGGPNSADPNSTDKLIFAATADGNSNQGVRFPFSPATNVWYHIALSRDDSGDLRAFVDGNQIGLTTNFPIDIFDVTVPLRVSSSDRVGNSDLPVDGWMEDFRFAVGAALYTSNFTPPGPLDSSVASNGTTTVIDDTGNPGIDEGRAMMQLIHDVAPDASVSFHTAFNGMADFAQGIQDLADDGADIIVDDIIYFAEPMFQDGIVAQAVDNVVGQGKAYFSSAGNAAQHSYESGFVASGERLTVRGFGGPEPRGMLHDFDHGVGVDWKQSVTIPEGTVFTLVAQWDQPFASNCPGCPGSTNDVDIYLVDDNDNILTSSIADNLANGDPVEVLQLQNTGGIGTSFHIMMTHYDVVTAEHPDPGPPPTLMKYVWFGHSSITVNEHTTDSPSSYGHANATGAAAVGAAFYLDTPAFGVSPPQRESFSSQGGVPILFDVSGNSLGVPGPREKPEFVAPDGTNTTFFYRDTGLDDVDEAPEAFPNFFGTSAAAPHAAAIAALMLEANPTLTPGDIYLILENTAVDMAAAGFDFDTGYGLIDATAAIAQATGGNLVPLAENDDASTDQNTLVSIPVLANDALGDQTTTITLVTNPPNGGAVINGTSIDYTPDLDYFGPDSFDYTIEDNDGETSIATVNVIVNEIDIQPLAAHDNAATDEDVTASNIDVMANDDPLGNAPTTITAAGPGMAGSNVSTDGSTITYAPAADFFGNDIFPYTITDGDGDSSNANLTVSVNPVNDAPVADNDPTSTDEDIPANFDDALMLAGDTDIENDPLSISLVFNSSAQGGTVSDNGGGNYSYTPPENFNGNDAVNYVVSDGNDTDTGTVTITVNAVNDAPDAGSVANQNSQDGDAGISVATATTDIENDTLTYGLGGQPAGLSINVNTGDITGTIDGNASAGGPLSDGVYTVTVTASDASLGTDYQFTWTISAGPVNGSPNAAVVSNQNDQDGDAVTPVDASTTDPENDTLSYGVSGQPAGLSINAFTGVISGTLASNASLGSVYTITVTADDGISTPTDYQFSWTVTDPAPNATTVANQADQDSDTVTPVDASTTDPDGDTLSYSVSGQPAGLSINASTGVISGTLASNASQGGVGGVHTVTVTASDGTTPTDYQFTWTVTNPAPVAVDDNESTDEDTLVTTANVLTNDTDADGDALSVQSVDGASANGGSVSNNGNGTFDYTPASNFSGGDSFNYVVSDGNGGTDTGTVNVTVNAVNDDPVAVDDNEGTNEDTLVTTANVLTNDTDIDGGVLSVQSADLASANGGNVVNNGNGTFNYTPAANFNGADSFDYVVTDGNGGTDTGTVNVTVNAINDNPVTGDDSESTDEDTLVTTANVLTNDTDVDGDTLSVQSVDAASANGGTVTNNVNGTFDYTPPGGFTGDDTFDYVVTDGNAGTDTGTVTVTVNAVVGPPADAPTNVSAADLGGSVARITWDDTNANEDGFELEREKQAGNGSWKSTTLIGPVAALTYDDASGKGTFRYRVRATNGSGASGWSVWDEVVVTTGGGGGNAAPSASYTYLCTDLDCDFDGSGSSDSDGTIASYSWDFGDGNGGSGATPNHVYAAAGTYSVTLTVTDDLGANGQDSQNVMVTEGGAGLTLSATGYKVKGAQTVDLTWAGATSAVDIYRDGNLIAEDINGSAYTDNIGAKGGGSYLYEVCEANSTTVCSNTVNVVF